MEFLFAKQYFYIIFAWVIILQYISFVTYNDNTFTFNDNLEVYYHLYIIQTLEVRIKKGLQQTRYCRYKVSGVHFIFVNSTFIISDTALLEVNF